MHIHATYCLVVLQHMLTRRSLIAYCAVSVPLTMNTSSLCYWTKFGWNLYLCLSCSIVA